MSRMRTSLNDCHTPLSGPDPMALRGEVEGVTVSGDQVRRLAGALRDSRGHCDIHEMLGALADNC